MVVNWTGHHRDVRHTTTGVDDRRPVTAGDAAALWQGEDCGRTLSSPTTPAPPSRPRTVEARVA
jgi:hypothetical protein